MFQRHLCRESEGLRDINVIPIVDVSLVLVTILILTSPMSFESSFQVRQTKGPSVTVQDERDTPLALRVVSEDSVEVGEVRVARAELGESLTAIFADRASREVLVSCRDEVSHGAFVNVLDQARFCGATEVAVEGN